MDLKRKHLWASLALVIYGLNLLTHERDPHEIIVFTAWFLLIAGAWFLGIAAALHWRR
jgi:hypothetical protein